MKEGKKQKKKMKRTVCLMSYLKKIKHNHMCVRMFGSWLMRLLTTYTLSDQQGMILRDYLLKKCMPINHLPVRNAYSFDKNRLTNA